MNRLEDELRAALKREDSPEGFAEKVMARLGAAEAARVIPFRPRRALYVKWAAAIAALLLITLSFGLLWNIFIHRKSTGEQGTTAQATRQEGRQPAIQTSPEPDRTAREESAPTVARQDERDGVSNQSQNVRRTQASRTVRAGRREELIVRKRGPVNVWRRSNPDQFVRIPVAPEVESAPFVGGSAQVSDTARHIERVEILLRSFRNAPLEGAQARADLAHDRQSARKLLYKNILLRREAAARGELPTEEVLGRLEPLLTDIANLPERPAPADVNLIRGRMQKSMTMALLQVYAGQNSTVE